MKEFISPFDYAHVILNAVKKGVLLTTKDGETVNTMSISWGTLGIQWGLPIFTVFVRGCRHTAKLLDASGEFTVNIALVEGTEPVLGVMFEPNTSTLYYGEVGVGAFRVKVDKNGDFAEAPVTLPLAKEFEPGEYVVVVSRSHLSPETEEYIDILREDFEKVTMVQAGSALKIARVAEGLAMEYPRFGPTMEWDTAAGDAIVRAAGGRMVRAEDNLPLVYNKADLHNPWFVVKSKLI